MRQIEPFDFQINTALLLCTVANTTSKISQHEEHLRKLFLKQMARSKASCTPHFRSAKEDTSYNLDKETRPLGRAVHRFHPISLPSSSVALELEPILNLRHIDS